MTKPKPPRRLRVAVNHTTNKPVILHGRNYIINTGAWTEFVYILAPAKPKGAKRRSKK